MKNTPKFIVFEGIDGAGKTTQIQRLFHYLSEKGESVFLTQEPTDSESGKALRRALSGKEKKTDWEFAAMFLSDRITHNSMKNGIRELLASGHTVICDRYYYSSVAYQGAATDFSWVLHANIDCPEIVHPDVCIFLDLTPAESMRRICQNRSEDCREIFENEEILSRTRENFQRAFDEIQRFYPTEKIIKIDASRSPDEVELTIRDALRQAGMIL